MKLIFLLFALILIANLEFSTAISNGQPIQHLPHNVYIVSHRNDMLQTTRGGGGSLISDRHVLTSARNLQGFVRFTLFLGTNRLNANVTTVETTNFVIHEQYGGPTTFINDIGIITVLTPIRFSNLVQPIVLPAHVTPPAIAPEAPLINEQGTIVGFGGNGEIFTRNNYLSAAFQRVQPLTNCPVGNQIAMVFCGQDTTFPMTAPCLGDHGAGFTVFWRDTEVLTGIVSLPACEQNAISVYTRVSQYRAWIRTNSGV